MVSKLLTNTMLGHLLAETATHFEANATSAQYFSLRADAYVTSCVDSTNVQVAM